MLFAADVFQQPTPCFYDTEAACILSQVRTPGALPSAFGAAAGLDSTAVAVVGCRDMGTYGVELSAAVRQHLGLVVLVLRAPSSTMDMAPNTVAAACGADYRMATPGGLREDLRWAMDLAASRKVSVLASTSA